MGRLRKAFRWFGLALLLYVGVAFAFQFRLHIPEKIDEARLVACERNLKMIHGFAVDCARVRGALPPQSGEAFYEALFSEYPGESLVVVHLRCVGEDVECLTSGEMPYRGYAFRDNLTFPARLGEPERAIAACGNRERQNHPDLTLVLMADGTIRKLSLSEMRKQGLVAANEDRLLVGPDSPLPLLGELRH